MNNPNGICCTDVHVIRFEAPASRVGVSGLYINAEYFHPGNFPHKYAVDLWAQMPASMICFGSEEVTVPVPQFVRGYILDYIENSEYLIKQCYALWELLNKDASLSGQALSEKPLLHNPPFFDQQEPQYEDYLGKHILIPDVFLDSDNVTMSLLYRQPEPDDTEVVVSPSVYELNSLFRYELDDYRVSSDQLRKAPMETLYNAMCEIMSDDSIAERIQNYFLNE